MNKLEEICARKKEYVAAQTVKISLKELQEKAKNAPVPRGFLKALKAAQGPALIAEVKKASPSKGVIRTDFDPVEIAKIYEGNGAVCLSVLTDEPYFQGKDEYLEQIREAVSLPLLRKDFMLTPYQVYESRALGADGVLLIMAALTDNEAKELHELSRELGMDTLVEVHDAAELERAQRLSPAMIGVNARNLKTLQVDLDTTRDLAKLMDSKTFTIAESGIEDHRTLKDLQNLGYRGFLVGESLMRQPDIGLAVRQLLGK